MRYWAFASRGHRCPLLDKYAGIQVEVKMTVTLIAAGLLSILYIWLSARVIAIRRAAQVSLGTGGDDLLERRMRAHGNFAEYAPLGLILIGLAEMNGLPTLAVAGLAGLLVMGRVLHAIALSTPIRRMKCRVFGMVFTFSALGLSAAACLGLAVLSMVG